MKKLMYFAAALLVLAGCNTNEQENRVNAPAEIVTITGGIEMNAQSGPRKVVAKDGWETASTVEFVWEVGDEVAVTDWVEIKKFTVSKILDDGKAEFTGEPLSGGMDEYGVYYPYESVNGIDYLNQQYSGAFRPVVCGPGSGNEFTMNIFETALDIPLTGSVKLGKIEYWIKWGSENERDASISMGEGGLQLTNTPQHVTLCINSFGTSFFLKFYDTNDQLIMEKKIDVDLSEKEYTNHVFSFPTLEVAAAPTYAYVDLGLPSGLKWATMNVGATKPEEYGDYFAWGETSPYYNTPITDPISWKSGKENGYSWQSYKGYTDESTFTEWNPAPYDANKILTSEYDAATANWGGTWRMPTKDEIDELKNTSNCTWTYTENYNSTGVGGMIVTSKKEGYTDKSIFLPASGYRGDKDLSDTNISGQYRSSSRGTYLQSDAYMLTFNKWGQVSSYDNIRPNGYSVRPVCNIVYK